jgi:hypothetical protein
VEDGQFTSLASYVLRGLSAPEAWGYEIAAGVSGLVGFSDILTRYPGNPWKVARYPAAIAFILFNAAFGVVAYWFAYVLGISGAITRGGDGEAFSRTIVVSGLAAGFLAVVILRTTTFQLGGRSEGNGAGPGVIIDALLSACDQSIDRALAADIDRVTQRLMLAVDYEKAKIFLPVYCSSLLENSRANLAVRLENFLASIEATPVTPQMKAFLLGTVLLKAFGFRVTQRGVGAFLRLQGQGPRSILSHLRAWIFGWGKAGRKTS